MKTEIYLVRHGQTEWNLEHRYQGSGDSPLTKLGITQAKALGKHLANVHFDAVYCSPASRAQKTASIVKGNRDLPVTTIKDFQEINLGKWEGEYYEDTKTEYPELYNAFWESPDKFRPDFAESFEDVGNRTYPTLLKLIQENTGKRILIVSHAAALKSVLNKILGIPLSRFWEKKVFQTSLSVLEYENGEFSVLKYGSTDHLEKQNA